MMPHGPTMPHQSRPWNTKERCHLCLFIWETLRNCEFNKFNTSGGCTPKSQQVSFAPCCWSSNHYLSPFNHCSSRFANIKSASKTPYKASNAPIITTTGLLTGNTISIQPQPKLDAISNIMQLVSIIYIYSHVQRDHFGQATPSGFKMPILQLGQMGTRPEGGPSAIS